jgi:hypothetical protein
MFYLLINMLEARKPMLLAASQFQAGHEILNGARPREYKEGPAASMTVIFI